MSTFCKSGHYFLKNNKIKMIFGTHAIFQKKILFNTNIWIETIRINLAIYFVIYLFIVFFL